MIVPDSSAPLSYLKCAFCNKPAVKIVAGYPVCEEHAEMLYKGKLREVGRKPEINMR